MLMRTSRNLCNPHIHICAIFIDLVKRVYIDNLIRGVYDPSKDHKHHSKKTQSTTSGWFVNFVNFIFDNFATVIN